MKKLIPILIIAGVGGYYLYKKSKGATAATTTTTTGTAALPSPGAVTPTSIYTPVVTGSNLQTINTAVNPVSTVNLQPLSAPAAPNPFLMYNPFL